MPVSPTFERLRLEDCQKFQLALLTSEQDPVWKTNINKQTKSHFVRTAHFQGWRAVCKLAAGWRRWLIQAWLAAGWQRWFINRNDWLRLPCLSGQMVICFRSARLVLTLLPCSFRHLTLFTLGAGGIGSVLVQGLRAECSLVKLIIIYCTRRNEAQLFSLDKKRQEENGTLWNLQLRCIHSWRHLTGSIQKRDVLRLSVLCVCVCARTCEFALEASIQLRMSSLIALSFISFETGSLTEPGALESVRLCTCLRLPSTGITGLRLCVSSYTGDGDLNSCPCACVANKAISPAPRQTVLTSETHIWDYMRAFKTSFLCALHGAGEMVRTLAVERCDPSSVPGKQYGTRREPTPPGCSPEWWHHRGYQVTVVLWGFPHRRFSMWVQRGERC